MGRLLGHAKVYPAPRDYPLDAATDPTSPRCACCVGRDCACGGVDLEYDGPDRLLLLCGCCLNACTCPADDIRPGSGEITSTELSDLPCPGCGHIGSLTPTGATVPSEIPVLTCTTTGCDFHTTPETP